MRTYPSIGTEEYINREYHIYRTDSAVVITGYSFSFRALRDVVQGNTSLYTSSGCSMTFESSFSYTISCPEFQFSGACDSDCVDYATDSPLPFPPLWTIQSESCSNHTVIPEEEEVFDTNCVFHPVLSNGVLSIFDKRFSSWYSAAVLEFSNSNFSTLICVYYNNEPIIWMRCVPTHFEGFIPLIQEYIYEAHLGWYPSLSTVKNLPSHFIEVSQRATMLSPGDDTSSERVMLSRTLDFFGQRFSSLFVNINGLLSFEYGVSQYTPSPLPYEQFTPIIAAFWADLDNRGELADGNVVAYETITNSTILADVSRVIRSKIKSVPNFAATHIFVCTWYRIGFYSMNTDHLNTFQIALAYNGRNTFAMMNYQIPMDLMVDKIALAGFDAGNGETFYMFPESTTPEIVNTLNSSNVGTPGQWIFQVDDFYLSKCDGSAFRISPSSGTQFGGEYVFIDGICFSRNMTVDCEFGDQRVAGILDENGRVRCYSPMHSTAKVPVRLIYGSGPNSTIDTGKDFSFTRHVEQQEAKPNSIFISEAIYLNTDNEVTVSWDNVVLDGVESNDFIQISLQGVIINGNLSTQHVDRIISNNVAWSVKSFSFFPKIELPNSIGFFGRVLIRKILSESSFIHIGTAPFKAYLLETNLASQVCNQWIQQESIRSINTTALPFCPPIISNLELSTDFEEDKMSEATLSFFHSGAYKCYRSAISSEIGSQQCCYLEEGELAITPPSSGFPSRFHSADEVFLHLIEDEIPFMACNLANNLSAFYKLRPTDNGTSWTAPIVAATFGDPHFLSLDGLPFTFNGVGEYLLLEIDNTITVQVRTQIVHSLSDKATFFTAIALKSANSDEYLYLGFENSNLVARRMPSEELIIFENNTVIDIYSEIVATHSGHSISINSKCGVLIVANVEENRFSSLLVSVSAQYIGKTKGLLGNMNRRMDDDLTNAQGDIIPHTSDLQTIHYQFGETWRISNSESWFYYPIRTSYSTMNNESFIPLFDFASIAKPPGFAELVNQLCGNSFECKFDAYVTNTDIASTTIQSKRQVDKIKLALLVAPQFINPPTVLQARRTTGITHQFVVNNLNGVAFSLNESIVGASVSVTGLFSWNIPVTFPKLEQAFSIVASNGKSTTHSFVVEIDAVASSATTIAFITVSVMLALLVI